MMTLSFNLARFERRTRSLRLSSCSPFSGPDNPRKLSILDIRKVSPRIGSSCNCFSAPEPLASRTMKQFGVTSADHGGGRR